MTVLSLSSAWLRSIDPNRSARIVTPVKLMIACLVLAIALLTSSSQAGEERYSFRSMNYQDRFVRHSNWLGELTPIRNDQDEKDATFIVRKALDGTPGAVSFEAAYKPGHFLRHQDFKLKLQQPYDGRDRQFREDASFRPKQGLADPQGVSYEAVHFPDHFIRHVDFHLWVNDDRNGQDEKFREDATFYREGPVQLTLSGKSQDERTQVCGSYASLAEAQGFIARARLDHLGTGEGCPGATSREQMWSHRTSDHFNFCTNDVQADARLLATHTEARRQFLLGCTRQRRIDNANKWPDWDTESSHNYSALSGGSYGLGGAALGSCEQDGRRIIASVELIRNDPSLLHDHTRDKGLGHSKEFHHFNHWKSFRCVQRATNVGSSFQLEGYTGQATARGPKSPVSPAFERSGFGADPNSERRAASMNAMPLG